MNWPRGRYVTKGKVRTGINTNAQVQIVEGLKAGERVVTGTAVPGTADSSSEHRGPPPGM